MENPEISTELYVGTCNYFQEKPGFSTWSFLCSIIWGEKWLFVFLISVELLTSMF